MKAFQTLLSTSLLLAAALVPWAARAQTSLADQPLNASSVPGNVLLTLSVEYPTAIDVAHYFAYNQGTTYSSPTPPAPPSGAVPFQGYYKPTTCYVYISAAAAQSANIPAGGPYEAFFQPTATSTDSNYNCTSTVVVTYTASYTSGGNNVGTRRNPQYNYQLTSVGTPTVTNASSTLLWSGNFLNWATMQTIDPFRAALTGGYRSVDTAASGSTPSYTILEKAWGANEGGYTDFPDRSLDGASTITVSGSSATPASFTAAPSTDGTATSTGQTTSATESTTFKVVGPMPFPTNGMALSVWGLGNQLYFMPSAGISNQSANQYSWSNVQVYDPTTSIYIGDSLPSVSGGSFTTVANTAAYSVLSRVMVCNNSVGLESNCVQHGSSYKPEGLMQKNAMKMRFGVVGYLNDHSIDRDGGVLRAKMAYVGPQTPVPGGTTQTNANAEWDGNGVYVINPDPSDATATNTYYSLSGSQSVTQSGVLNYVNSFGEAAESYKAYDPVSELYYTGVRYFKNLGNVPQYTGSYSGYGTNPVTTAQIDGFPVITSWDDPIQYACQKNFILGIGDVNTHADGNLPSNPTFDSDSYNPSIESAVSGDTSVNTEKATDQVGYLEGMNLSSSSGGSTLGDQVLSFNGGDGDHATYGIAGLAYDSHVTDIRPNSFLNPNGGAKQFIQTISTYWVDVQEYEAYHYQNQFWLAAKYGGFTVPSNWSEYKSTPSQMTQNMWNASGRTDAGYPGASGKALPDNYFSGGRPDLMEAGLASAFTSIASAIDTSTAFSLISSNLNTSNNVSYSTTFNPSDWTGNVTASTLSFDSAGNPSLSTIWQAQSILDTAVGTAANNTGYSSRVIATMNATGQNSASNPAAAFESGTGGVNATNQGYLSPTGGSDGAAYLAYLRGAHANEGANGTGAYRARDHVLGDIVNSHVIAVAAPGIAGTPESYYSNGNNPNYSSFVSNHSSRGTMIYVGANDGMLHAFNGSTGTSGGKEIFAYVPTLLYKGPTSTPTVNGLANFGSQTFSHHYFVDSTPVTGDVDFANTYQSTLTASASTWHSILVGGLGKGGKGYYALDITSADTIASESTLASDVLWEFTNTNMGFSYGKPVIAKTKQYGWVVLVTSGYNNADGQGHLFVINPATGATLQDIKTSVTSASSSNPIGLGPVAAFVPDLTDGTVDAAYAGDLNGNLWRFDLTATSGTYPAPVALFSGPSTQPITSSPLIEIDPVSKRRYVLFGTGNLLDKSDIVNSNTQSFYAVIDGNAGSFSNVGTAITRTQLTNDCNTVTGIGGGSCGSSSGGSSGSGSGSGSGGGSASSQGWYIDLPVNTSGGSSYAEQVVSTGNENYGVVAFAAQLPSSDACNPAGTSVVYAVSLYQGQSVLTNSNGSIIGSYAEGGTNTGLQFVSVNGVIELLSGINTNNTGSSTIQQIPGNFNGLPSAKFLNWREVNLSH